MTCLEHRIAALAAEYLPLAREILAEAIRVPSDFVDRPVEEGGDPACGLSNHEGPRLQGLRMAIIGCGAVRSPQDVWVDAFGNLVWTVEDPNDGIPRAEKKVIYWDGHSDTVAALRDQWRAKIGGGIDAYDGLVDADKVDVAFLEEQLGWLPPEADRGHLLWGRGSADQLGGVVAQVVAAKILLELVDEGALKGVIIRSYASAAEEDNDGGGPMYLVRDVFPGAAPEIIPDVVILTEGTGCAHLGALGIYRGQRGRMQIELEVVGRSCHGSMPWEGLNPLEWGGRIVAEAADAYDRRDGFLDHAFLGHGTRTASMAHLDTPSDCAVPDRLVVRFDRRLTVGETPEQSVADIEALPAVAAARAAGLDVTVHIPRYTNPTWTGYRPDNAAVYPGWVTPEEHPAIQAAVKAYRDVITPNIAEDADQTGGNLRREPRVARWIFSTDGVGFPVPKDDTSIPVTPAKQWVVSGAVKHPAMLGLGPGMEQNTHKIGECMDTRELRHAIAFLARFPSALVAGE